MDCERIMKAKRPTLTVISSPEDMSEVELAAEIRKGFDMMATLTEFAIRGYEDALIISGASGIGKSHDMLKRMNIALERGEINKFTQRKGNMSALGLYKELYNHRRVGDVLLLDDIDVFDNEKKLDILKSVMDFGTEREVTWGTATTELTKEDIPTTFKFEGTCIFITNKDFDDLITKNNELTPHLKAMIGRATYLDLCVHSNKSVLIRIKQLFEDTDIAEQNDITPAEESLILDWLEENQDQVRELSIRTVLKIARNMHVCGEYWESLSEKTLFKSKTY